MTKWVDILTIIPPRNRILLCYCPKWCETGYQSAGWNGKEFFYHEQPNDNFSATVLKWSLIYDAD